MTIEQDAQLVGAIDKLVFAQHMLNRLGNAAIAEEFMQGENRVVAGMVGIMAGGSVCHVATIVADGEIIRNRNRLIVRDEKSILRPKARAPCANSCVGARLIEIDGCLAALLLFFLRFSASSSHAFPSRALPAENLPR